MALRPARAYRHPDLTTLGKTELLEVVRSQPIPEHIAIIMDGNGRWATRRGFPRVAGHRGGAKAARAIFPAAHELGLRYPTLYAFSTENWARPRGEVATLMRLPEEAVRRGVSEPTSREL